MKSLADAPLLTSKKPSSILAAMPIASNSLYRRYVGDELRVGEGVGYEVLARLVVGQLIRCRFAHHDRDRIEYDRRPAVDLLGRLLQALHHVGISTIGDVDTKLAALEAVGTVFKDRQRRAFGQVGDRLACKRNLVRQLVHAQSVAHGFRQIAIDMAQVPDHPLTDRQAADLAQFEDERVAKVALLDLGLADVDLARLTVVIGKGLGTHTYLGPLDGAS